MLWALIKLRQKEKQDDYSADMISTQVVCAQWEKEDVVGKG